MSNKKEGFNEAYANCVQLKLEAPGGKLRRVDPGNFPLDLLGEGIEGKQTVLIQKHYCAFNQSPLLNTGMEWNNVNL